MIALGSFLPSTVLFAQPQSLLESGLQRIVFLSCIRQDDPQPLWKDVQTLNPDLILLAGDNVYADSGDLGILHASYKTLSEEPTFKEIRKHTPLMATWDDHDFGINDGGVEHTGKVNAQQAFLDFMGVKAESPRRKKKGIYNSRIIGEKNRRIQIIMLDTRYFRSPLNRNSFLRYYSRRYEPSEDSQQQMLGEQQWKWLESQLLQPAELRIIVSSIQFLATNHGFERWETLPKEKDRMLRLLQKTQAKGVIFVSGDRHIGELMRADNLLSYPLYDITASGFNSARRNILDQSTDMRVAPPIFEDHFGSIDVEWSSSPKIHIRLHGANGKEYLSHSFLLETLHR